MIHLKSSRIRIYFDVEEVGKAIGELRSFLAPRTIRTIQNSLPLEGRASLGKEMIYFEIPIKTGLEKAKKRVTRGTIAYWPLANAICVFYSDMNTYSPVNVIGFITDNIDIFERIRSGMIIKMDLDS
jgi:hypothetical protein